jgi:GNAT superfamily N-acetyltransferase
MATDATFLMIDTSNAGRHDNLLHQFERLYSSVFREPDSREDPAVWLEMFATGSPRRYQLFILLCLDERRETVLAGAVLEYYNASRCALLAYLVVDPGRRGEGLASLLFKNTLRVLQERCQGTRVLFAETNAHAANEGFDEYNGRMDVLEHFGFRLIDVAYAQPSLHGGNKIHSLILLGRPIGSEAVEGDVVAAFLCDFYAALGIEAPELDDDYIRISETLGQLERLDKLLPRYEDPALTLSYCSLSFHFCTNAPLLETISKCSDMTRIDTFQDDILSYPYLHDRGIRSYYSRTPIPLMVSFPDRVEYTTENLSKSLRPRKEQIQMYLSLSLTEVRQSPFSVFSINLISTKERLAGQTISEYEVIQLAKSFTGKHEPHTYGSSRHIHFSTPEAQPSSDLTLDALPGLFGIDGETAVYKGYTANLLLDGETLYDDIFPPIKAHLEGCPSSLHDSYKADGAKGDPKQINAVCGLIASILDFDRMSFSEAVDTLSPSHISMDQATFVHRDSLVHFRKDLGEISPANDIAMPSLYATIPNIMAIYNENTLDAIREKINTIQSCSSVKKARIIQKRIRHMLSENIHHTMFQYPLENTLYQLCIKERRQNEYEALVWKKSADSNSHVDSLVDRQSSRSAKSINTLLAFMSGLGFAEIFQKISREFYGVENHSTGIDLWWYGFALTIVVTVGLVAYILNSSLGKDTPPKGEDTTS